MNITAQLKINPKICAANNGESFFKAANGKSDVIFLLNGDICDLKRNVLYAHDRGKKIFIHFDLANGLGKDESAVKFVADFIKPDGIISTKTSIIRAAKQKGLMTVFRVFIIDSQGVKTAVSNIEKTDCDFVEVMPGVIPGVIKSFAKLNKKLIAGGLISSEEEVSAALNAGAIAVSTSCENLLN